MENLNRHFTVPNREIFQIKMLNWLKRFNIFCFLNNNDFEKPDAFPCLVAAGVERDIKLNRNHHPFTALQAFHDDDPSWLFGHFDYELNTALAGRPDTTQSFEEGYFFAPDILLSIEGNNISFIKSKDDPEKIFANIMAEPTELPAAPASSAIRSRISRQEYLDAVVKIKAHIKRVDCYELNFCQQFYGETSCDPATFYKRLCEVSPQPFSAFYRINENYCCCASPERFLQKTGRHLLSQPIKGTIKRGEDDASDRENYLQLQNSQKDKSENVMVVDLVRNDLSRVCKVGSVQVPQLFSIKSYPGVHQMVSSITGEMEEHIPFSRAIEVSFPMGSMTGAPKVRVMELIEQYEKTSRNLFSGSIGYITPEGDFDFNVVIRSLFINTSKKSFSFQAGGGITHYSDPQLEFEESLLKTMAIRKVLGSA